MELDTGGEVSVMSEKKFAECFPEKSKSLKGSDLCLKTCSGENMKSRGVARVNVSHNEQSKTLNLYVVSEEGPSLFGRE